jgi:hypothetical protein
MRRVPNILLPAAAAVFLLLQAAAAETLPYRLLHVNLGVGHPREGPPGDETHVASVIARFREKLDLAGRLGFNYVLVAGLENYVPNDDPFYGPRAERFRPYLEAAIRAARERRIGLVLYGDEAVYLPSWLERAGATASVKDPRFWEMLQEKYRRLLAAFPELDGLAARVGEVIPYHDFEALDLMHSRETEPDPRAEERSRRFVLAAHRVVAGEFGKLFLYRTWATSDWEQHSVPAIYRATFTEEVPAEKLLISIKLTKQDAWYYGSAFNPNFGQTPHPTVAEAELYSQYHGFGTLVDFPIRWFASALRSARLKGAQGVMATEPPRGTLPLGMLTLFSRLAADPFADEEALTRQWAAETFGDAAAGEIARILLESSAAVREAFYLPAFPALGWNPLPHVRVRRFVARGDPLFDDGRGHDEFLRELYLMSRPYLRETYESVARGHARHRELRAAFEAVRDRIARPDRAEELGRLLEHGVALTALLRDHVDTVLSYFGYREQPGEEGRRRLAADLAALRASAAGYRRNHDYYDIAAAELTVKLAERMLEDRERAERILREAPTRRQLLERFEAARNEHLRALEADPDAQKFVQWRGTVDGRVILRLRGEEARIEDLAGDGLLDHAAKFFQPVERRKGGRWLVRPVRARGVVYLMEEPSEASQGTLSLYIDDPQPGNAVYEIELYWSARPLTPAGARPPSQNR